LKRPNPNNNKEKTTMNDTPKPDEFRVPIKLFDLGQTVATPGALAACSREYMLECLGRHISGDWGCVDAEDRKANFDAMFSGERILSAYGRKHFFGSPEDGPPKQILGSRSYAPRLWCGTAGKGSALK
jgi:hypothetical protein